MEAPKTIEKYGKTVKHLESLDDTFRKENSMCLNCGTANFENPETRCQIAKKYYELCQLHGNAFVMTRCEVWTELIK